MNPCQPVNERSSLFFFRQMFGRFLGGGYFGLREKPKFLAKKKNGAPFVNRSTGTSRTRVNTFTIISKKRRVTLCGKHLFAWLPCNYLVLDLDQLSTLIMT